LKRQLRSAPSGANKRARAPLGRAVEQPPADPLEPVPGEPEPPVELGGAPRPPVTRGGTPRPPGSPTPLIFAALDGPEIWLVTARSSLLDILGAAREGARRPHKRVLSRAEIRRQSREAFTAASALLDEAAQALRVAAPLVISQRTSSR